MEYTTVERDFVERTLEILGQYDRFARPKISPEREYEVTLLLNCLLGLVVLPFESLKRTQPGKPRFPRICDGDEVPISQLDSRWGLDELVIDRFVLNGESMSAEDTTLRRIVAMVRHSIAHSQFGDGASRRAPNGLSVRYQAAEYNPIESIILNVNLTNRYRSTEFIASIPVAALRQFAITLATTYLTGLLEN